MMRLNKFLASAGVISRRKADVLIASGKVKINGEVVTELGTQVDESKDSVECSGQPVKIKADHTYIALNKPIGYISSASNSQGKSVLQLVNRHSRLYPVGRLDKDSRGLIIITDDGDLTYQSTHAKFGWEKEYEVIIDRPLEKKDAEIISRGMIVDGKKLQPVRISGSKGNLVRLVLKEGINRQIRKMLGLLGYHVSDLKRIRIGKLELGDLKDGEWRKINREEI
jgi:23S rRNA pseudouridine2605 synthase/23S rRNA pseudouridine2604 synthase